MNLMDRVEDPLETVEFTIEGRGLLLGAMVVVCTASLSVIAPAPLRWLLVAVTLAIACSALRGIRWSPLFAGPILTLSATEISGRGGLGQPAWRLGWDQVDRFEWGRNGLFVYRRGAAEWQNAYRQGGLGGPRLVAALTKRLGAYQDARKASGQNVL